MGNGNRAQQKRERNAAKGGKGEAKSQLKANEAAKSVKCELCKQAFQSTVSKKDLADHVDKRHKKNETYEMCFGKDEAESSSTSPVKTWEDYSNNVDVVVSPTSTSADGVTPTSA